MKVTIPIYDTETNETRLHVEECEPEWIEGLRLSWISGNYSCDCNRSLFFARCSDPEIGVDEHGDCSEGRYVCPAAFLEDGTVVVLDGSGW